ncbi:MAG: hypothetical protein COX51_09700 [Syntrophobacteraceae bacterium CG23_combo_of_CG06-09_8_20_14_all_50_8]|nr:MAG: hypothetical protein COX51_09700 [Syntrophobacteraceae bacterium CG23_combo_of_CG06-09_8_20_14_all_50_8]
MQLSGGKAETVTKKSKRILIIDDEDAIRDGCCQILSRKGYKVESTGNALQAMEMAFRDIYDVILLDIRIPLMGGMEILKKLKNEKNIEDKNTQLRHNYG